MGLSLVAECYLNDSHVHYQVLEHPRSQYSIQTARISHIAPAHLAKAVVLKAADHYLMCVLPASHRVVLSWIDRDYSHFHKSAHRLVGEAELSALFPDCELGAIPAIGQAFGIKVVWDSSMRYADEIYLEGGDHRHVFKLQGEEFMTLMDSCDHATISCTPDTLEFFQRLH